MQILYEHMLHLVLDKFYVFLFQKMELLFKLFFSRIQNNIYRIRKYN